MNKYYEQRYIKNSESKIEKLFLDGEDKDTLSGLLNKFDKIVLLGNPGIGKTTELKMLFNKLWETKNNDLNFPFFINLKNFRIQSKFEDLIPFKEWNELPSITFILDGLDEIANINDFISEFENFIKKNEDKNIKYVVSCRTNIYEKYLIKISSFNYFYLETLTDRQIASIVSKNIGIDLIYADLDKFRVFLENPFTLNLFLDFYRQNGSFPSSVAEAFELSVKNELSRAKIKFKNREEIDISYVSKDLMKVAFVNELMQQSQIEDENLSELVPRQYKSVIEQLPFLDKIPDTDKFMFRHKNYQEFFAAKHLSQFKIEEIINLIKISDDINKTKPSLFNTITFLLNILEYEKFIWLKNWLLENEPEILFLAENERIDTETQKEIFRKYFESEVIEKTFWIGRNRRFSQDKIAEFADVEFLIETIRRNEHFRTVISALNLLSYIDKTDREEGIKSLITELIFAKSKYSEEALRVFSDRRYHLQFPELFNKIVELFKDDFNPEINHLIIKMVSDFVNIDEHFPTLINCLYKLYEIRPERIQDNTIRGTSWILEKIILRVKNEDHFLEILKILFDSKFSLAFGDFLNKSYKEELLEKCLEFDENEKFLFILIDYLIITDKYIFYRDEFVTNLIAKSKHRNNLFIHILDKLGLSSPTYHILSLCVSRDGVDYFTEVFKNRSLKMGTDANIEHFRNHISHYNFELALELQSNLEKQGLKFEKPLPTIEEFRTNNIKAKQFAQENFDILFDKDKLAIEISNFFEKNELKEATWKNIHEITWKWYEENNYPGIQNSVFSFIENRLRNSQSKTKEQILKYLEGGLNRLYDISKKIKDKQSEGFEIKSDHLAFIKTESLKAQQDFDYNNVVDIKDDYNAVYKNGYHILNMLFFLDKEFNIGYTKEFYLKTVKYSDVPGIGDDNLQYIFEKVNDKEDFDKTISNNLMNEEMDYATISSHIDYALTNKLENTYEKIGDLILYSNFISGSKDFIRRYTDLLPKDKQIEFLKKCCENTDGYLCWQAVQLLQEKDIEKDFLYQLALDYIKSGKQVYFSNALDLLFYFNDVNALKVYLDFLKKFGATTPDLRDDFYIKSLSNFTDLDKLYLLKDIFYIVYDENNNGTFDYHHSKANIENLISHISTTEAGYRKVQKILSEIKIKSKDKGSQFFYINHLIDSSQQAYYNSLSKPLNFLEAKKISETNADYQS